MALTCSQIWWTTEVGIAFSRLEEGYENAMKEYHKKQVAQLNALVTMLLGQLSQGDRQKVMTICTIDVHARDVVAKMIAQKVGGRSPRGWPRSRPLPEITSTLLVVRGQKAPMSLKGCSVLRPCRT